MGSMAAELLIRKIEDERKKIDRKVTIETLNTELIIRESTKKKDLEKIT